MAGCSRVEGDDPAAVGFEIVFCLTLISSFVILYVDILINQNIGFVLP